MPKPIMQGHATMKSSIDSMICKLFYLIIIMIFLYWRETGCIGYYGGLQVDFDLGLGLPIQGPSPPEGHTGTCRVSVESRGPPP